jgi:hypothetical protein
VPRHEALHLDALAATLTAINSVFGKGDITFMHLGQVHHGYGYVRRKFQYGGDEREFALHKSANGHSVFVQFLGKRIKVRSPYNDDLPPPPAMVVPIGGFDHLRFFHLCFPWATAVDYRGLWNALTKVLRDHDGGMSYRNEPNIRYGEFNGYVVHVTHSTDSTNNIQADILNNALSFCTPGKVGNEDLRQYQKYPLPTEFQASILQHSFDTTVAASTRSALRELRGGD